MLDSLESTSGPFTFQLNGEPRAAVAPSEMPWADVLKAAASPHAFCEVVLCSPEISLPGWKLNVLRERYARHFDLPDEPEMHRLCRIIDRYGKAIEYDFAVRGIDLEGLWRARRWRKLLNLLDRLPRNSHYVEAQLNDDDLAEVLASQPAGEPIRRISEWSPEVETLSTVADRLVDVLNVLLKVNGGHVSELRPQPRPSTAIDRARLHQRQVKHQALVARVLAHPE